MHIQKIVIAALLASAFAPAFAAIADDEQAVTDKRVMVINRDGHGDQGMMRLDGLAGLSAMAPQLSRAVKGMPYSAEMITERQQNLADGNQIVTKHSAMSYRDGAGRTRQETLDPKGDVMLVTINDPVTSTTYILHPKDKTGTKISIDKEAAKAAGEAARAHIEQLRKEGKLGTERNQNVTVITERSEGKIGDKDHPLVISTARANFDAPAGATVILQPRDASAQQASVTAALGTAFGDAKWSSKASTKELGSKEIDGVKADGKLRSYEIPAGEVGNRNAIVVSDETWYSPELRMTVYSKHSDPRSGDNIFRLASLKRDEPAAALFAAPSDYTIKDVSPTLTKITEKK